MKRLPQTSDFPGKLGGCGGFLAFAKAQGLKRREAQKIWQGVLSYMLPRPSQKQFFMLPTVVFNIDEQWVADLIEVRGLARWKKGTHNVLNVADVLSKYAWVEPLKSETGTAVTSVLQAILKRSGITPQKLQMDADKEFYNRTFEALKNPLKVSTSNFLQNGCLGAASHETTFRSFSY